MEQEAGVHTQTARSGIRWWPRASALYCARLLALTPFLQTFYAEPATDWVEWWDASAFGLPAARCPFRSPGVGARRGAACVGRPTRYMLCIRMSTRRLYLASTARSVLIRRRSPKMGKLRVGWLCMQTRTGTLRLQGRLSYGEVAKLCGASNPNKPSGTGLFMRTPNKLHITSARRMEKPPLIASCMRLRADGCWRHGMVT